MRGGPRGRGDAVGDELDASEEPCADRFGIHGGVGELVMDVVGEGDPCGGPLVQRVRVQLDPAYAGCCGGLLGRGQEGQGVCDGGDCRGEAHVGGGDCVKPSTVVLRVKYAEETDVITGDVEECERQVRG